MIRRSRTLTAGPSYNFVVGSFTKVPVRPQLFELPLHSFGTVPYERIFVKARPLRAAGPAAGARGAGGSPGGEGLTGRLGGGERGLGAASEKATGVNARNEKHYPRVIRVHASLRMNA